MTELLGVGGFVPRQICAVAPFVSKLQTNTDPMHFALETFTLMQIAIYVAGFGAGGCKYLHSHVLTPSRLPHF